jgi:hypothetical protein
MATQKEEIAKQLAESPEMNSFYRALEIKHSNSIQRVFRAGGSAKAIIERAKNETKRLLKTEQIIEQEDPKVEDHKCKPGLIWDEVLGACVPIGIDVPE